MTSPPDSSPEWRRGTFLSRLSTADYQALVGRGRELTARADETLLAQGNPAPPVFFLLSGIVKIQRTATPDSAAAIIDVCGAGDALGLESLLRGRPGHLSFVAKKPTRYVVLAQNVFEAYLERNPHVMPILFAAVAGLACDRDGSLAYATHSNRDRLVAFLTRLARLHGVQQGGGVVKIDAGLSHSEIGSAIGCSKVAVQRTIRDLKKEGIIDVKYRTVLIKRIGKGWMSRT